jgi:putative transposase
MLWYDDVYYQVKRHETYRVLPAQTAQQTLKVLDKAWKAFHRSMEKWVVNPSKYRGRPKPPGYKVKNGRFVAILTNQQCKIRDGYLHFPATLGIEPVKTRVAGTLKEVRIVPTGTCYKLEIVHDIVVPDTQQGEPKRVAGIDLGVNNLATLTTNIGTKPIVVNGKVIKSINQFFNKERGKLMAFVGSRGTSNRIAALTEKRNGKINDIMHKASRFVVDYCQVHGIEAIAIGKNDGWKVGCNLGRRNNQNFVSIPFNTFIHQVRYKAEERGIRVVEHDEAHTSKCSFLDNEPIGHHDTYAGKRVCRGLFRSAKGITINADVNGSYNHIRNAFPNAFNSAEGIGGCALHPVRINITT